MLRVIDISSAQAGLDLATIADQFDAVMIKATGGNGYVDPFCDGWVQQAIALGKKWGVYHYFSDGFNDADPIAEANWFVDNCSGYVGKGILALDWERGGNPNVNDTGMAARCAAQITARTNVNPLMYMSLSLVTGLNWQEASPKMMGYGALIMSRIIFLLPISKWTLIMTRIPNGTGK